MSSDSCKLDVMARQSQTQDRRTCTVEAVCPKKGRDLVLATKQVALRGATQYPVIARST